MFPEISSNFYDEFDPIYREEVLKLFNQIEEMQKKIVKHSGRKALILWDEFSSKYFMPKKIWDLKMQFIRGFTVSDKQQFAAQYHYQFGHFSKDVQRLINLQDAHRFINLPRMRHKILCYDLKKDSLHSVNEDLQHKFEKTWRDYEINDADSIIPKAEYRRFEKIKLLYSKILAVEDDVEEWFKALMESDDYEFITDNVEFRLHDNIGNKKLWKLYLEFLRNAGHYMKLVETYSKYCRYFLEDSEMLEQYQKVAVKICPSVVPWKNVKSFEIYSENVLKYYLLANTVGSVPPPVCHQFNRNTASSQKFLFRLNLMNYIVKNAIAPVLYALYKSCKYFYCVHSIGIVYKFNTFTWHTKDIQHQTIHNAYPNELQLTNKIFISTVFCFELIDQNLTALSNFIPKIYRCTAKYVNIENQNLTYDQLKLIIGHGEVIELKMSVKDQEGNPFKFEDIIILLPKIQKLNIKNILCSSNISPILCEFTFKNKIEEFCLSVIKILPDPYAFAEFILKNASTSYSSFFRFYHPFTQQNVNNENYEFVDLNVADNAGINEFHSVVNNIINGRWEGPYKPYFMFI